MTMQPPKEILCDVVDGKIVERDLSSWTCWECRTENGHERGWCRVCDPERPDKPKPLRYRLVEDPAEDQVELAPMPSREEVEASLHTLGVVRVGDRVFTSIEAAERAARGEL